MGNIILLRDVLRKYLWCACSSVNEKVFKRPWISSYDKMKDSDGNLQTDFSIKKVYMYVALKIRFLTSYFFLVIDKFALNPLQTRSTSLYTIYTYSFSLPTNYSSNSYSADRFSTQIQTQSVGIPKVWSFCSIKF